MALLKDMIDKFKNKEREPTVNLEDDGTTTDKVLMSLRKDVRLRNERDEKEQLRQVIREDQKQQTKRNLFGMADSQQDGDALLKVVRKKKQEKILKSGNNLLKNNDNMLKGNKPILGGSNLLKSDKKPQKQASMLGRSRLI